MNPLDKIIGREQIYYIARDKEGRYLNDIEWLDESGSYELEFENDIFVEYKIFRGYSAENLYDRIKEHYIHENIPEFDIYKVVERTSFDMTKV